MSKTSEAVGEGPETVLLYCQCSVSEEAEIAVAAENVEGFSVKPVMVTCSSKVQVADLLKILDRGADGVEVVACPDEACRFLIGSRKAEKRIDYARSLLDEIGVGGKRLGISWGSGLSAEELMARAAKRARAVKELTDKGGEQ